MSDASSLRFWRLTAAHLGEELPWREASRRFGEAALRWALAADLWSSREVDDGDHVACTKFRGGCGRRVRRFRGHLFATCGADQLSCRVERMDDCRSWVRIDSTRIARSMCTALGFPEPRVWDPWDLLILGVTGRAEQRTVMVLARSSDDLRDLPIVKSTLQAPAASVIAIDDTPPRRILTSRDVFVCIDTLARMEPDRLAIDFGLLTLRSTLSLDPMRGEAWWNSNHVDLRSHYVCGKLFFHLAASANQYISAEDLARRVWPEDYSSRTGQPRNPVATDRKLRQNLSALQRLMPEGLTIERRRACGDDARGLRLATGLATVEWLSRPV